MYDIMSIVTKDEWSNKNEASEVRWSAGAKWASEQ